jgi:hypothetical protein
MRIDPKLRYLTDLAARARNVSLTEYIEEVLWESFKRVSIDQFPELNEEPNSRELSRAELLEKFKKRSAVVTNPLSDVSDGLWSEHPFVRLQLLAVSGLDHLMSHEDNALWEYIVSRRDLKSKDGKLNHKLISEQWAQIKADALKKKGHR